MKVFKSERTIEKSNPLMRLHLINGSAMTGASCASEISSEEAPVTLQWSACSPASIKKKTKKKIVRQKNALIHCKHMQVPSKTIQTRPFDPFV